MKTTNYLIVFTSLLCSLCLNGQQMSVQDSIKTFSDSLFQVLETNYLHRKTMDWARVKTNYINTTRLKTSFEQSLMEYKAVFDAIGCDHCQIFSEKGHYTATQKPILFKDYSEQFVRKYTSGVEFSVSEIEGGYGYVVIPAMFFMDLTDKELNQKSQEMYDQILALEKMSNIKGWIIDLRFNIGGDAYLMLTALYHFLGNKVVYLELDANQKNILDVNQLKEGKFYAGKKIVREINAQRTPDVNTPVALIIGNWTNSAGEDILLGFSDRSNVIKIGEPTYGSLTGNEMFKLPFNCQAAISQSYLAYWHGKYQDNLQPDIYIKGKDNFDDLLKDENIMEAINFIDSKMNKQ